MDMDPSPSYKNDIESSEYDNDCHGQSNTMHSRARCAAARSAASPPSAESTMSSSISAIDRAADAHAGYTSGTQRAPITYPHTSQPSYE